MNSLVRGILLLSVLPVHFSVAQSKAQPREWRAFSLFLSGDYAQAAESFANNYPGALASESQAMKAQATLLSGNYSAALSQLGSIEKDSRSSYRRWAAWRKADLFWQAGKHNDAQALYAKLTSENSNGKFDYALAMYRIATAYAKRGEKSSAISHLKKIVLEFPEHPLAQRALSDVAQLAGPGGARLTGAERVQRAHVFTPAKNWHEAILELRQVDDSESAEVRRERDFWLGMTLFKMRRHYLRAGEILTGMYKQMGNRAAEALFHGARALSRADQDSRAIEYYLVLARDYAGSKWAAEAHYLAGWLSFNNGNYRQAITLLDENRARFRRTKFIDDAEWFAAYAAYLAKDWPSAQKRFATVAQQKDRLWGGKGNYWLARSQEQNGEASAAAALYRTIVESYPFSWYALLATARLKAMGIAIGPFGDRKPPSGILDLPPEAFAQLKNDPLLASATAVAASGLGKQASQLLRANEKAFRKKYPGGRGLSAVLAAYWSIGDFNRPWMISVSYGDRALDSPPVGPAKAFWQYSLPLAYRPFVEKWTSLGKNPPYYLYSIMRKESGFNPYDHSYADAIGLLQMIPPTTIRVCQALGIAYFDDLLFDPELNIRTGSWYIGRLLQKFDQQVPIGAGSFNAGPKAMMKWLDRNGERPMDEFVELISYTETREYMKKLTEIYARYVYLYENQVYEQPLNVDPNYLHDEITY